MFKCFFGYFTIHVFFLCFYNGMSFPHRIQKDAIDPEKLKETLGDEHLNETSDLKRAMEMVALLEAQLKDLSPNLDSIAEYGLCNIPIDKNFFCLHYLSLLNQVPHKGSFIWRTRR
jgi:hypothetical protein